MDFVEAGPSRRGLAARGRREHPFGQLVQALLDGKTVLVQVKLRSVSGNGRILRRHGYRLHTRKDPDGIVAWAEKIAE